MEEAKTGQLAFRPVKWEEEEEEEKRCTRSASSPLSTSCG